MGRSFITYVPAVVQLVGKVLLPFNLSVFPTMDDTTYTYGIGAIILIAAALLLSKGKRMNYVVFGMSWFLLFLLAPFARIQARTTPDFSEHRLYMALFGMSVVLMETDVIKYVNARRTGLAVSGLVVIAAFSAMTYFYSGNFRNGLAFWKNAVKASPRFFLVHRNLGTVYQANGMLNDAIGEYKKALALDALATKVHNNLGCIYLKKNMLKEAEAEFRKEYAVNPYSDSALVNLGLLFYKQGRATEAEELWEKALGVNPECIDASRNLAIYYYERRDFNKAARYVAWLQARRVPVPREVLDTLTRGER